MKGKAKEDFENWFMDNELGAKILVTEEHQTWDIEGIWHELPDSMQWGVIVEWFDSVGIDIEISKTPTLKEFYYMIDDSADDTPMFRMRSEARAEAIEKACEIYINK